MPAGLPGAATHVAAFCFYAISTPLKHLLLHPCISPKTVPASLQMFLPNAGHAVVPLEKISGYLLNSANPRSRGKVAFFLSFGFTSDRPELLANALNAHALMHQIVVSSRPSYLGTNYVIEGPLDTPDGRNPIVRSIWFVGEGETFPRLVTAYAH